MARWQQAGLLPHTLRIAAAEDSDRAENWLSLQMLALLRGSEWMLQAPPAAEEREALGTAAVLLHLQADRAQRIETLRDAAAAWASQTAASRAASQPKEARAALRRWHALLALADGLAAGR